MKLRLNLSTTPLENKRPFAAAATVLGAVGLLTKPIDFALLRQEIDARLGQAA